MLIAKEVIHALKQLRQLASFQVGKAAVNSACFRRLSELTKKLKI